VWVREERYQPSTPARQTSTRAVVLKIEALSAKRGFRGAGGGVEVVVGGGRKGVAGERCVAEMLFARRACKEEEEPRDGVFASEMRGREEVLAVVEWARRADSSVGVSSTASSSPITSFAGVSENVKPR